MKNVVCWDIMPRGSLRTNVSEEHIASIIRATRIGQLLLKLFLAGQFLSPWWWRRYGPPKRWFLQGPDGVTYQKTLFTSSQFLSVWNHSSYRTREFPSPQLNPCGCSPLVTSSKMRVRMYCPYEETWPLSRVRIVQTASNWIFFPLQYLQVTEYSSFCSIYK
jgi:hypothetical protein